MASGLVNDETLQYYVLRKASKILGKTDMAKGAPGWYTTTVKLDMEAPGLIVRHGSQQMLKLAKNA